MAAATTTYYGNAPGPPTRCVQFPFTLSNRGGALLPAGSSYTIETWLRLAAWSNLPGTDDSENSQMVFLGAGSNGYCFFCRVVNDGTGVGRVQFASYTGGLLVSPPLVRPRQWLHLRLSYDAGTREGVIYADNVAVATGTFDAPQHPFAGLNLGHIDSYRTHDNFNGQLDETRVWPGVRSTAQNAASWQLPNYRLPDLPAAAAAWDYEDPLPAGGQWAGFADGSGHGQLLMSSTNGYDGSQPESTVPAFGRPAGWSPAALGRAWDFDPAHLSPDGRTWPSTGTALTLTLHGTATPDPQAGPNGTPCVSLANHSCYEGDTPFPITGAAPRTHLVVFATAGASRVELMGWGLPAYDQLYDTATYYNKLIQHYYGYQGYSTQPVPTSQWNAWLVRATPLSSGNMHLDLWLNGTYAESGGHLDTGSSPLRLGLGRYIDYGQERRLARVLIWDDALSDQELDQVRAWLAATYGLSG